ncbi:hypothetical protein IPZ69_26420 [Streptomyces olivochromogenes]|nr:hypothetical protein [Streptomyces olivochromogenes]
MTGPEVGDPADGVPGPLDGDHEQDRDHRLHAHAQRVDPAAAPLKAMVAAIRSQVDWNNVRRLDTGACPPLLQESSERIDFVPLSVNDRVVAGIGNPNPNPVGPRDNLKRGHV